MKNNKIEIIKMLINVSPNGINIRKLSQEVDIPYSNVYNIVKKLEKNDLIFLEKNGQAYNCYLNNKVHPLIFQAEYERRNILLENRDLLMLKSKLNALRFQFIALIFGSYSKNQVTKSSDIDLMIISENNRINELDQTISLLPLNIHLVSITYDEFFIMAQSKKFNVISEVIDSNIVLIGIEDYYRMLENVK